MLRNLLGNFRYQFWRIALLVDRKREHNAAATVLIAVVSWLCAPFSSFAKSPKSHGANRRCQKSVTRVRRIEFKCESYPKPLVRTVAGAPFQPSSGSTRLGSDCNSDASDGHQQPLNSSPRPNKDRLAPMTPAVSIPKDRYEAITQKHF
jgi:hypothetical protein